MLVIPAIDLRGGFCVRLTKGELSEEKIYSKDPVFMAKMFKAKGAKLIHVVDLDGAFSGVMKNRNIIFNIRKEAGVPVETGGGIRNPETIDDLMAGGIDRVILGTVAFYQPEILKEAVKKYPGRIIVSIDCYKEKVAIAGWKEKVELTIYDLVEKIKSYGVTEIIYTDINKDGTLEGLDVDSLGSIVKKINIKTIISGGVGSIDDIKKIKKINSPNIAGVIAGKAIYEEKIDLAEAIRIAEE